MGRFQESESHMEADSSDSPAEDAALPGALGTFVSEET